MPHTLVLLPDQARFYVVYRLPFNFQLQPGDETRITTADGSPSGSQEQRNARDAQSAGETAMRSQRVFDLRHLPSHPPLNDVSRRPVRRVAHTHDVAARGLRCSRTS